MGLRVEGRKGALAVVLGFASAVMTLSKTILYGKPFLLDTLRRVELSKGLTCEIPTAFNEYHSGFKSIGHNSVDTIIFLWIIPK